MNVFSWLRRNKTSDQNPQQPDHRILGVTDQLVDRIKSFTLDTFRNFPLKDSEENDDSPTTSGNVRNDLSDWQQRHATLVLSKVKELSQLRYKLCPGYMKENQFWGVYFSLVKTSVAEYELQAIRLERIKEMALENGKSGDDKNACEVEMAETKSSANLQPPPTP